MSCSDGAAALEAGGGDDLNPERCLPDVERKRHCTSAAGLRTAGCNQPPAPHRTGHRMRSPWPELHRRQKHLVWDPSPVLRRNSVRLDAEPAERPWHQHQRMFLLVRIALRLLQDALRFLALRMRSTEAVRVEKSLPAPAAGPVRRFGCHFCGAPARGRSACSALRASACAARRADAASGRRCRRRGQGTSRGRAAHGRAVGAARKRQLQGPPQHLRRLALGQEKAGAQGQHAAHRCRIVLVRKPTE